MYIHICIYIYTYIYTYVVLGAPHPRGPFQPRGDVRTDPGVLHRVRVFILHNVLIEWF